MFENINYAVDADGIATLTINVPGRTMNVLTPGLMDELDAAVARVAEDDAVRGAVITSGKANAFIAGADLMELVTIFESGRTDQQIYEFAGSYSAVFRRMETCGKPLVAAINGTALGGGLEVTLACHYRVALDNPKAKLGLPEVTIGLLPGAGGTQRLPRLIGVRPALELMTQGKPSTAPKAVELGICHELASDPDDMIARARAWILEKGDPEQPWDKKGFKVPGGAGAMHPVAAQTFMVGTALTAGKTLHNYPAPIAIMSAVFEGTIMPIDKGLKIEQQYFTKLLTSPVSRNMIRTLFIDKGAAEKLKRRPEGVPDSRVEKLGILGAGMMGAGVAFVSARAGMDVVLLDRDVEAAERGKGYSAKLLEKRIARGRGTQEEAEALLAKIHTTADYADLEGCDLIIEAVFEDMKIKADVTAKTEAVIPSTAVFASNTSTLPITGLAKASQRPGQFIGIHFFSPVDKMPLVEIILGKETDDATLARSLDYVKQIRKTPIVVQDSRGFYTSRVFGTYVKEGMAMLAEGVKPALIENAAKMAGMPVGPLAVSDEVTIELSHHILNQTKQALGDAYVPHPADDVVVKFHEKLKRSGRRHGAGFYDYPEGQPKHLWPGLAEVYPPAEKQPSVDELQSRMLCIQSLETVRCMAEGVVTDPAEADVGSILGWGFPAWAGGTVSYIDTMGVDTFITECERLAEAYGERFAVPDWLRGQEKLR